MEAIKYQTTVEKDGEIRLTGVPLRKGQRVEMIVLVEPGIKGVHETGERHFDAVSIRTAGYRFDREQANER
ncbi:MAG TPA: hypothetical protein PK200_17355 [Spirochaetota bacterium]|nr:hypothetical protein [Spirochaetota bacterium]HQO00923.1 hypothetical protein [Spirochaetota bacterium]HQP48985.1 hypothetical protein [Spirochaetota bacterium]